MSITTWRWKALSLSAICFAAAAVDGWLAGSDMIHIFQGFGDRRTTITSERYSATGLLLTPMAISIGLIFLFSKQATPEEMKNASKLGLKWTGRYLAFLIVTFAAALFAPIPQYMIVDHIAVGLGYVACPHLDWQRHQPDRWALPGMQTKTENCPDPEADPNL